MKYLILQLTLIFAINVDIQLFGQININSNVQEAQSEQSQIRDAILDKDYSIAKKALRKAVETNDKQVICAGVRHFTLEIRLDAVAAMSVLKEMEFVPCLIEALEFNQQPYRGGTESRRLQNKLNINIVVLLEKLTELELFVFENLQKKDLLEDTISKSEVEKILELTMEWLKFHKNTLPC